MLDAAFEIAEEIPELGNGLTGHSREAGVGAYSISGTAYLTPGNRLGKGNATIKQQPAHLADQGRSVVHKTLAGAV